MSDATIPSVERDFGEVLAFLKDRGVVPKKSTKELVASARRLHRATYALILWRFRLTDLPEHGRVFIEEIASDALQILPQTLVGYGKTSSLLTRGIIENTLRHLYFSDHPVEYARLNRDPKWYMSVKELFEYPNLLPSLMESEIKFSAISKLKNLYFDLSATVHGRAVTDLEMRIALRKIVFDQELLDWQAAKVQKCAEAVNFILATFHADAVRRFRPEDRRIVLRSISIQGRAVLNDLA